MTAVTHQGWTLHYTIGGAIAAPVQVGDVVPMTPRDGEWEPYSYVVTGGASPHRVNSTGRVYVGFVDAEGSAEYYQSVIGARWVHEGGGWAERNARTSRTAAHQSGRALSPFNRCYNGSWTVRSVLVLKTPQARPAYGSGVV